MHRDSTAFRDRFERWKNGEQVYENGRVIPGYETGKNSSKSKDGTRYLLDELTGTFNRITADEMANQFADLTVTPNGNRADVRSNPVYHDPRLKYAGYITEQMLKDEYNAQKQRETSTYAPGLELTYPEFDLMTAIRPFVPTINGVDRKTYLIAREMNKGLKKNPMLKVYNSNPSYLDTGGNILQYQDYINNLFPNSKIKDIVYHSTWAKPFEQFDPSRIKRGYGFYFSPSENHLPFDRMVYSRVNIQNPLKIFPNENRNLDVSGLWKKDITEQAIKNGQHDGVIGVSNMRNPGEPEIVALNPNQIHILGSNRDIKQFSGFVDRINRKPIRKYGYRYKNGTVTPDEYKYYGQKVNYFDPSVNELSDYQLDDMIGNYIGRGAERTVYQDLRNSNRVLKITDGGSPDVQITNSEDLLDYIDESLKINDLPEVPKLSYEGFIKDGDRYLPVFSQQKVTPLKKVADPFQIFTRQYILPNGKTPSGKLTAIRKMNPDAFSRIGYKPIPTKPGVYSVNGVSGLPYNVTDLGQKNVGIDALGNLKIFDPMFE